ncbi:MAG: Plug domain-containing protein [Gemmatimonadota bacterium]|nr:Plug domain-containing protein [Gemmatimonadota bacterium]
MLLATCACASGGAASGAPAAEPAASQSRSRSTISGDEIRRTNAADLYDALREIRPGIFISRGKNTPQEGPPGTAPLPIVYIDGVRKGDVTALHQVQVGAVRDVLILSGTEATQRFGVGHVSGALLVSLAP